MQLGLSKQQLIDVLKVALWVGVSASIDALISATTGTQFGPLTPVINLALVTLKKAVTRG